MTEVKASYSEAQKRAIYKYRAKNKDAYNKYQRERHNWRLDNEDGYREKKEKQYNIRNEKIRKQREAELDAKVYVETLAKPRLENIIITLSEKEEIP